MRDAIGGAMTIQIILIFLLLINGYLAFSVNYTKAFRTKNQIISIIEQHEGLTKNAQQKIKTYLTKSHYNVSSNWFTRPEKKGYTCFDGGYCVKVTAVDETGSNDPGNVYRGTYYSVITFVNIDIPIINKIFPMLDVFQVKGETKTIYSSGTDSELEPL